MKKRALFVFSLSVLLLGGVNTSAVAKNKKGNKVKNAMQRNYRLMNDLMVNILLENDYAKVIELTDSLNEHGKKIGKLNIKAMEKIKQQRKKKRAAFTAP